MTNALIADSASIKILVGDVLNSMEGLSFTLFETENGQEAWEIVERGEIDLIISGNSMPGMTGLALAKKVKAEDSFYKEIPFVFCSGASGSHQEEIEDLGAINFPKPYSIKDLEKLVRSLVPE